MYREGLAVAAIQVALNWAMRLDGALGAAVFDYISRMPLGARTLANGSDLDRTAHRVTDVVRAHLFALDQSSRKPERLEDILITLDDEYHLIRPLTRRTHEGLFLLVILDRARADLDTARRELRHIEELL